MQSSATLVCPRDFNASEDAERLYRACKGLGTKEDEINQVLGHRNQKQRGQIREAYYRLYGEDLVDKLKSETSGDYRELLQTMFRGQIQILAYDLYEGLKKRGTDATVLNEILCCCTNDEIYMLKKAYQEVLMEKEPKTASSRSLESDIAKDTKPPYETLLLRLLQGQRKEDDVDKVKHAQQTGDISILVNEGQVQLDVRDLYNAGPGYGKTGDPDVFIQILSQRSKYEMKAIWDLYKKTYGTTLVEAITTSFSDPLRTGLNTVVMALVNLRLLMVCQLFKSMKGLGTNEDSLIRIICLRCEIDLGVIKRMYEDFFGKPLAEAIKSDTSGDFRKLLLMLVEGR